MKKLKATDLPAVETHASSFINLRVGDLTENPRATAVYKDSSLEICGLGRSLYAERLRISARCGAAEVGRPESN